MIAIEDVAEYCFSAMNTLWARFIDIFEHFLQNTVQRYTRPTYINYVWRYRFVSTRPHDGRSVRILNLIDEYTRESLLVRAEHRRSSAKVISALADVMVLKGVPKHLRSDNGAEFVAEDLRKWLEKIGAKTLYIEPGSPCENGYCKSFNSKLRDELLNGEIFYSMKELRVLAERWRVHYNTVRPHSPLGYRPPAPAAWLTNNMGHGEVETASHISTRRLFELRKSSRHGGGNIMRVVLTGLSPTGHQRNSPFRSRLAAVSIQPDGRHSDEREIRPGQELKSRPRE